jgi:phage/plasmid-associated DNA primase
MTNNGFTAKEFEPDPAAAPEDDETNGGAAPGSGHNRSGKPTEHAKVGEALLGAIHGRGEALCRIYDEKGQSHLWYYQDGLWTLLLEPTVWLEHAIEVMLRLLNKANKSRVRFVTEVRKYIERNPSIRVPGKIRWDEHGKVPTRSGLIDPVTLAIEPFQKEHYATWRLDLEYDPTATCPLWEELLRDYFDAETPEECEKRITLLQDFSGTTLIDRLPKALKRALVLLGASDTGKSVLLRVLSAMLADTPISTALADISGTHSMEEFLRRAPWVLDEAFENGVWLLSGTAKAIISREPLSINPKGLRRITKPINAPPLWGTNHPPTFKESTDAMVNRLLIVLLTRVFDKNNPVGVAAKAKAVNPAWEPFDLILARERAGVLNWMLAGLQRVLERGNFVNTAEGEAALTEMELNANPVAGFIADCIKYDASVMISKADFHASFTSWRYENHGDEKVNFSRASLGRYLSALANPDILQDKDAFKKRDGSRYYIGIRLNEQGSTHFQTVLTMQSLKPELKLKFPGISTTKEDTCQPIPTDWLCHPKVVSLQSRSAAKKRDAAKAR